MKKTKILVILGILCICLAMVSGMAFAEEKLMVKGKIKNYNLATKTLILSADDGKDMTFIVEHDGALKKLDSRLEKGDEVKVKYTVDKGKNLIKGYNDLRGTKPGC
ncbi:MAG: hypothetical protein C0402_13090 [Thermodesulfovibrio sp.]|nr:hypothetical protein [Thermodesulfovibrio sp.]